jgi:putative acetyltransferase
MRIVVDDLRGEPVRALLEEHLAHMHQLSPPESVHALDLAALRLPAITFWTAWKGDVLLGCGALKQLDAKHGEIKSMRTANGQQRQGVASALLQHILAEARRRGYDRLSLETGPASAFGPAHALYIRTGFTACGPFANYGPDPFSVFMTLDLTHETLPC